jgi:hypothetical protein
MNMSTSTTEAEPTAELTCLKCHSSIDYCSFCDESRCGVAVCYGCLIEDLGETVAQPHDHGG